MVTPISVLFIHYMKAIQTSKMVHSSTRKTKNFSSILLLTLVLFSSLTIEHVSSRLFIQSPVGQLENTMINGDDELHDFSLNKPIMIGTLYFKDFKVSFNGGIVPSSTNIGTHWSRVPRGAILAYWADAYFKIRCEKCEIKIVRRPNAATLDVIRTELGIVPDIDRTMIITWHEAPSFGENELFNTFQAIITGDAGGRAYTILSYETLQYGNTVAKAGVKYDNHYAVLQGSGSSAQSLTLRSNVGIPGVFVIGLNIDSTYYYEASSSSLQVIVQATCSHVIGEITYNGPCPAIFDPQCGSDGVTYGNTCEFNSAKCRNNGAIKLVHQGSCGGVLPTTIPTTTIPTPKPTSGAVNCAINNGGCEDMCNSAIISNRCHCTIGSLNTDGKTCNYTNLLISSSYGAIYYIKDEVTQGKYEQSFQGNIVQALSYDYNRKRIFYGDYSAPGNSTEIGYYQLPHGQKIAIMTLSSSVEGMAFDAEKDQLYITQDKKNNGVFGTFSLIVNVYSEQRSLIDLTTSLSKPRGLALDYCHRIAFVADWGLQSLWAFYENGSPPKSIVSGVKFINHMSLDRDEMKVYFTDADLQILTVVNYDGSCRRIVAVSYEQNPYGIVKFGGDLYWTNLHNSTASGNFALWKTNIYTGKSEIKTQFVDKQFAIEIFRPQNKGQCKPIPINPLCSFNKPPVPGLCWHYGSANGDTLAPSTDDDEASIFIDFKLKPEVPFFTKKEGRIYISPNGIISAKSPDYRSKVTIPETGTGKGPYVAGYVTDMVTYEFGKIWYRESNSQQDLGVARQYTFSKDPSFAPNHVIIVTFEEVAAYSPYTKKQTFQVVIVSSDEISYAIWCFGGLDQPGGTVGFYENPCNYGQIHESNIQLVQGKTHVMKLTNDNCASTTLSPVTTQRPTVPTQRPSTPTVPTQRPNTTLETVIYHSGTFKPLDFGEIKANLYIDSRFSPAVIFNQIISGTSMNFMYFLKFQRNASSTMTELMLPYLTMLYGRTSAEMRYQVLAISDQVQMNDHLRYGKINIPIFSIGYQNCISYNFPHKMSAKPSVILNTEISSFYISQLLSTWLSNVTEHGFQVCVQELFSFSGGKANLTIHYLATTNQGLAPLNDNNNKLPNEAGVMSFVAGQLPQDHPENENLRYCQTIRFSHLYQEAPYVFVTPQVGLRGFLNGQIIAWIRDVYRDSAIICAKNQHDYYYGRIDNIFVHYTVKGKQDVVCGNYNCPDHLQCYVDRAGKPSCGCIESCPTNANVQEMCGNDFVTYKSLCDFHKETCKLYGKGSMGNFSIAYQGNCQNYPYESGSITLDSVPGIPVAFCKYVTINSALFHPAVRMHFLLTVQTTHNVGSTRTQEYDAAASWSEDASTNGFKACVMIAGRHFFGGISAPIIHWVALQVGIIKADKGAMDVGMVEMPTWYTGSRCVDIDVRQPELNPKIAVSVQHSVERTFSDAMTAWSEKYTLKYGSVTTMKYRVCSRELQNFDGIHRGVKIHWVAFYRPIPKHVPQVKEIVFTPSTAMRDVDDDEIPVFCKTEIIGDSSTNLQTPVVILSPAAAESGTHKPKRYSNNDFVSWIQSNNGGEVSVCVKSVHAAEAGNAIKLNMQVLPNLCGNDWSYYENRCFHSSSYKGTYSAASDYCQNLGATLPVLNVPAKSYYAGRLVSASKEPAWIGLTKNSQDAVWKWSDGSSTSLTDWLPGQPNGGFNENCAIIQQSGTNNGWGDMPCSNSFNTMCEKGFVGSVVQTCTKVCHNAGRCVLTGVVSSCQCATGYYGEYCENQLIENNNCINYVTHDESYRRYSGIPRAPVQTGRCDRDLVSNTTWHRFVGTGGTRILEKRCPNSNNHCGALYPGWLEGEHPEVSDGTKRMELKFYFSYCASTHGTVNVKNCGNFFVYNFEYFPYWDCNYGICTV